MILATLRSPSTGTALATLLRSIRSAFRAAHLSLWPDMRRAGTVSTANRLDIGRPFAIPLRGAVR